MTDKVTVVDYGSGNLLSITRGLEHSGGAVEMTGDPHRVAAAERLVLPGVGAYGKAMGLLREHGLADAVQRFVETGRPFLGICVGMQMMMDYGEEFGRHDGLGLIPGHVSAIPSTGADGEPHPVPHVGWNRLANGKANWDGGPLSALEPGVFVYFVHSFASLPDADDHVLALCDYNGRTITAAITKDNIIGCQFHPEKSGPVGLSILRRFIGGKPGKGS